MKKIKVASLFASLKIGGGVEKIQSNLSIGLIDLGYDFTHLLMNDIHPRNDYKGHIHNFSMKFVMGFGYKKILSLFILAWKVARYCNKNRLDLVIGQGDFFFMVTVLSKLFGCRSKMIAVVHTSIGIWNSFMTVIMRLFISLHDHIVMTSAHEMQTFIKKYKFPQKKLSLIYNAIDIKKVLQSGNDQVPSQRLHLFENGRKIFVNVGRLNYQKNQQLLVRAFAQLQDINTQLIVVGGGDEQKNLEQLISDLHLQDRVFLIGNQINPHAFVARSDYRVLSSRFEGFPMVFIEGGLFAKPMIAVDCPTGPREFLDPESKLGNIDGFTLADNGVLVQFNEQDPSYLKQAMEYVLAHYLHQQKHNVQKYCQQFNNTINAQKRDMLIQSLVS